MDTIPRIRFAGDRFADAMGTVFAENLADLLEKYEDGSGEFEKGFLHTSTHRHEGDCYYDQMWSRDTGRGLQELARLGFAAQSRDIAGYLLTHMTHGDHWGRVVNMPSAAGDCELDGNTHVLNGIYQTWIASGSGRELGKSYLDRTAGVFGWMETLMDSSPYGSLIPCVSELSGNPCADPPVWAIYPNYGAYVSFLAFARMAGFCGDAERSARYGKNAGRLLDSILRLLVSDGDRGFTQTPAGVWINGRSEGIRRAYEMANFDTVFPVFHWTRQLPFIQCYDIGESDISADAAKETNTASYEYIRGEMAKGYFFRKYGFVSNTCWSGAGGRHDDTMCGYGQNYFSQAALLTDDVNTYTKCLEGIARLAYDGDIAEPRTYEMNPWVLHECFDYEAYERGEDHTFGTAPDTLHGIMDCPGDEGNLVQASETLKTLSIAAGLSLRGGILHVGPRLPWTWDTMEVRGWPVWDEEGREFRVSLLFRHERWLRRCSAEMERVPGINGMNVRFGPFPAVPSGEAALAREYKMTKSRGASWLSKSGEGRVELQL